MSVDPAPLLAGLNSIANSDTRVLGNRSYLYFTMFMNERGLLLPRTLLDQIVARTWTRHADALNCVVAIATALASADDARLEQTIDETEAHSLIPHAARMRIVLAHERATARISSVPG